MLIFCCYYFFLFTFSQTSLPLSQKRRKDAKIFFLLSAWLRVSLWLRRGPRLALNKLFFVSARASYQKGCKVLICCQKWDLCLVNKGKNSFLGIRTVKRWQNLKSTYFWAQKCLELILSRVSVGLAMFWGLLSPKQWTKKQQSSKDLS